jgi:hypothetical protein
MARGLFYTTEKIGPKQSLTPEGFLLCEEVPVARSGMMVYGPDETPIEAGPEGIVKIFREDMDIFRFETIASAQGKPVTNDHPDDDVTPDVWKDLTHGILMNVRRGIGAMDDLLLGDMLITTPEGIAAVKSGKREVSLGYEADYTETAPGMGRQSNIIINHIALVEQGRCGPRCAIADHKSITVKEETPMKNKPSKILDALMKAFKAKDAAEVEKLAEEVKDAAEEGEGGETHVHIHAGEAGDQGGSFTKDDDFQAHVDKNETEHAEMFARIEALEKLVAGGDTDDKKTKDAEEEEAVKKEAMDEVPEELKEEASKAKDSAYLGDSFRDTVAQAEILVPGIRIPTFDAAQSVSITFKKICGFRRQALDLAYAQPGTRAIVDDVLGGQPLDTKHMTCDAIRTLFRSASAMKRSENNQNNTAGKAVLDGGRKAGPMSIADLNAANRKRYADQ